MLRRWAALLVGAVMVATVSGVGVGTAVADRPAKSRPYDKFLKTAIADIQDFWQTAMTAVYGLAYQRIPDSKIHAYDASTNLKSITECARRTNATYKDFKGNAFFCELDGTVNYDNGELFPRLYQSSVRRSRWRRCWRTSGAM